MTITAEAIDGPGFRPPTEAEWELFCRAGAATARPFGASPELLPRYAWMFLNSDDRSRPAGSLWPNRIGLFDVLGNQWEWCHDGPSEPGSREPSAYPEGTRDRPADDRPAAQVVVGEPNGGGSSPATMRMHRGARTTTPRPGRGPARATRPTSPPISRTTDFALFAPFGSSRTVPSRRGDAADGPPPTEPSTKGRQPCH